MRIGFLLFLAAGATACRALGAPLAVGYLYPAVEYDSENSLKWIAAQMESRHGAQSYFFRGEDVDEGRGIDSAIWGGVYNGHSSQHGYDLEFTAAAGSHPIFAGVKPWRPAGTLYFQNYRGRSVAPDLDIFMYGRNPEGRHPVAWSRLRKGSRIFFTSDGVQDDFRNPDFQKVILNAVLWTGKSLGTTATLPSVRKTTAPRPGFFFRTGAVFC